MFRANDQHKQQSILDTTQWMNPKIKQKLEKSWAPIFYEHVFCKIDEQPFSVLYGTTGKPNTPVNILLSLEYIKHIKDCSDLELLDNFYFDYLVNYALGIRTLGEIHLAERTLYYFRERIYQYSIENPDKEDMLFGQFVKLLNEFASKAGVNLSEQRTDTTMFMSNIKKAGRISLAYDVLVKAVKAIPEKLMTEVLANVLEPDFKTDTLYRTKVQEGDSKLTLLLNLCNQALDILSSDPDSKDCDAARIVRRFIKDQSTKDESGKLIPKDKKEITTDSLQSAHDEDATYRKKADVSQSGYVLELAETCDKDNPFQLITDYTVETNITSDVEILTDRLEPIHKNTGCKDMYADGGFHSQDVSDEAKKHGVNMHLTDMSGTEPTKKIPVTDFTIDENTNIIGKCPGNQIPSRAVINDGQTIAHFPHSACSNCEQFNRCHSKRQKKDYVVRINLKAVNAGRERAKIKEFKKVNTSKRAGIEGSNSALKRTGLKKLKVRGKAKSKVVCGLKVAAQNIKRFTKYLRNGYKPKIKDYPVRRILVPIPV